MTRRRKIFLILGIVAGVLIAGGVGIYLLITWDEPPPDVSDLLVHRLDVPDDQNAFTYFSQAESVFYWQSLTYDQQSQVEDMQVGKNWDEALAADVLAKNEKMRAIFQDGMSCTYFQFPEVKSINTLLPYVFSYLQMARVFRLRAVALARSGHDREALDQAVEVIRFGHRIEHAKGGLVHCLVGSTITGMGLDTFEHVLRDSKLPPEKLRPYISRLAEMTDNADGFADAVRVEYEMMANTVDDLHAGRTSLKRVINAGPNTIAEVLDQMLFTSAFLPNQTKRFFAETYRVHAGNMYRFAADFEEEPKRSWSGEVSLTRRLNSGNAAGTLLCDLLTPAMKGFSNRACAERTGFAATQVKVAIKCFKVKTGRLPQSLDELVPEYLPAVPLDNFDGKPIRYSREKKILYSVGKDLKDSGGFTRDEALKWCNGEGQYPLKEGEDPPVWELPDPSFPIDF